MKYIDSRRLPCPATSRSAVVLPREENTPEAIGLGAGRDPGRERGRARPCGVRAVRADDALCIRPPDIRTGLPQIWLQGVDDAALAQA